MQASVDLKSMSFQQIQQHVSSLESKLQQVSSERDEAINEKKTFSIKEKALQSINTLAEDIVRLSVATPMSITRRQWIANQIQTFMVALRDCVVNISSKMKNGVIDACKEMYRSAINVMNFIYDHFDSILIGAVAVSTVALFGALCLLSANVEAMGGVVQVVAAGVEANPYSYLF